MDPAILGGLGAAVLGAVLGSVISLYGASRLEDRQRKDRWRAAARALWCEVTFNWTQLDFIIEGTEPSGFSDLTWRSVISDVALLVTERELMNLNVCYGALGSLRSAVAVAHEYGADLAAVRTEWEPLSKDLEQAAYVLKQRGFTMAERKRIHAGES